MGISPPPPPPPDRKLAVPRAHLLRCASVGELTPEEVERIGARAGLDRFSNAPDPEVFDPGKEVYWTMPMAVAWIAFRSMDRVRDAWDRYCSECWEWRYAEQWLGLGYPQRGDNSGSMVGGWHLRQPDRPTLVHMSFKQAFAHDPLQLMSISDAQKVLWSALQRGVFNASGLYSGSRIEIADITWLDLVAVQGEDGDDEVRDSGGTFRQVRLPSAGLLQFWPEPKSKSLALVSLTPPEGDGYMPLYSAAQWIASKGGTMPFEPGNADVWRIAFGELLDAIASDKVKASGLVNGMRELVPGYKFAGCEVDYPHGETPEHLFFGDGPYLRSHAYVDEDHWRKGFDDALVIQRKPYITQLMVEKAEVRARWPFGLDAAADDHGTGLPGRPSKAKYLIEDELHRRAASDSLAASVAEQGKVLLEWLRETHPDIERPTVRTIENNIRSEYRRLKNATK